MKTSWKAAAAGLTGLVLSLGTGCTAYQPPALDVSQIRLAEETPSGLVLQFDIDAHNSNPVELPLYEVRYTVRLENGHEFSGVRSPEATLRRLGTQRITFPAAFGLDEDATAAHPTGLVRYWVEGELRYITPGHIAQILFDLRIQRPRVMFRDAGVVDLGGTAAAGEPSNTQTRR